MAAPLSSPESAEFASLAGRAAVVTGSTSGIGRAIALELAAAGADVLVHGNTRAEAAEAVAKEVHSLGRDAHVVMCDLANQAAQDLLVERAWQWRGDIDIWINNAGADVLTGDAASWPPEKKLDALWNVDVLATVRLSRLAGERMKRAANNAAAAATGEAAGGDDPRKPRPVILNMGWDQAERGMAGDSGQLFAAAKGAVMAFTRSLARSLAPSVRINCLAPGWIKTEWGDTASAYWDERARRESLLERWGTPEDVARVARFLVSPAAEFVNGQVVPINGGFRGG
jgi:3-oxoacyl-[acyl-carrier protein] reductase